MISIDDRAHYLDLIGHQDVAGMAGLLRRLSEAEAERIEAFKWRGA